jgi:acyl-[acyl-carrier-protein]-phospholipid O-acyltransferase / long-chain-fatty-acid--[acyl-carrier-protein] ligase
MTQERHKNYVPTLERGNKLKTENRKLTTENFPILMFEPPPDWIALPRKFLRMCRRRMRNPKAADSTGIELNGAGLLTRTLVLRRLLRKHVLAPDEQYVGVLLPPSVGGMVANAALAVDRRIAVNLNYTASSEVMNSCVKQCGIKHILTSKRMLERFDFKIDAEFVPLEDFSAKVTSYDKIISAAAAWVVPTFILERHLGLTAIKPDDLLTVIFTSGSTGRPKGVMLTQYNVGSNVDAINEIISLRDGDVLLGILPFFHSFGFTVTLWTVLTLAPKGIYHYTPLEAREVGKLCQRHGATIMIGTPTFVRSYLRRCEPENFKTLEVVFAGAEKLPVELAEAFEQKYKVRPMEGYGATELSPVVSGNIPPGRGREFKHEGVKEGTVGRPLPGISAKVIDLDTGKDLGPNRTGMLLVTGPNVMKGYFERPDLSAEVLRDGWYITGDVAEIDDDGFIRITGRVSRFSKIGGEMVPHIRVEEAVNQLLHIDEEDLRTVVTSVPDAKRGERLVILHTELPLKPEEICRKLGETGLPALWIPSPDDFRRVDSIPVLGTGKLDLKRVKDLAVELFGDVK